MRMFKQYEYKKSFEQWGKNKVLKGNWTRVLLRVKQKIFHWATESSETQVYNADSCLLEYT